MPCWKIIKGVDQVEAAKLPYRAFRDIRAFNFLRIIWMDKWLILAKDQLSIIKRGFLSSVFLSLNS